MNFEKEIVTLLSSSNFLIYIVTEEEERFEYSLNLISKKIFKQNICSWDFIEGYSNKYSQKNPLYALNHIQNIENESTKIFLLKDFNFFINDLSIIRKIKNISQWIKKYNKYIFFTSTEKIIPDTLQEYITLLEFPLPNYKEINQELNQLLSIYKINNELSIPEITNAYKGFSIDRIRKSLSKISNRKTNSNILADILKEKKIFIEKPNLLDFYYSDKSIKDIAGLKNLKRWLRIRQNAFSQKAYNYGIALPKGILLVGIQGTGKSLSAKVISKEWNLPLLKLDISKIFTGILGESENKIQKVIRICEKISPCILWIDEIEKIFYNINNNNDSGTTNRINNIFLTWLAEKNKAVFIVATANNLENLPIEILRKGRFDEIFFVNLPNLKERMHIFQIYLSNARPLTWHKYNICYLSKISTYFSGAEIEQAVNEGMYRGFYENREFNTNDIILSIEGTIPLAYTRSKDIKKLQEWAKLGKIRLA